MSFNKYVLIARQIEVKNERKRIKPFKSNPKHDSLRLSSRTGIQLLATMELVKARILHELVDSVVLTT